MRSTARARADTRDREMPARPDRAKRHSRRVRRLVRSVGAAIGAALGQLIGSVAGYLGFFALLALGAYMIVESQREASLGQPLDMTKGWGLAVASLSISLDSLGIGFSILYIHVPLYTALIVIGIASVAATFAGIALGRALGRRAEEGAELWAGIILAATGLFFILNKALHWGI